MQNFNYHQHTYRCKHAELNAKDEDYVQEYLEIGLEKIAFTDHCPEKNPIDKRKTMRMRYDERIEYLESIKKLKNKYSGIIDIQVGYEFEYLPGEEANIKELKDETDILILGQHFVYNQNGKDLSIIGWEPCSEYDLIKYAEYLEKAMILGFPDIIAHPDLFMLGREKFGKIEEETTRRICETASKYNIPLEINLNNIFFRTFFDIETRTLKNEGIEEQYSKLKTISYPDKGFWKTVSEYDIKVLYGLDVHNLGHIRHFEDLIKLSEMIIGKETLSKLNFIEKM